MHRLTTSKIIVKKNDYLCPKCKGHLNAGGYVIFSTKNNRNKKGLILLSPDVGSYTYKHHDEYVFEEGEIVEFNCPICLKNLKSSSHPEFAGIIMVDHHNLEYNVLFSRKTGVKSTYVISPDDVEVFGDDAADFDDVLDEPGYL